MERDTEAKEWPPPGKPRSKRQPFSERLKTRAIDMPKRKQCNKCPWKITTDPNDIPNGYCSSKHAALKRTIANPGDLGGLNRVRMMACHETPEGDELPCVGWLANQLGPGNNLALRLAASRGSVDCNVETDGEQHERFEDTLP
jgi:hypothetical protein